MLEKKEYDIIACQEFTLINEYYNAIKTEVEKDYEYYIYPETWKEGHFKSVFIIKKALEDKVSDLEILNFAKTDRYTCIKITFEDKKKLILVNMHIDEGEHNEVIKQIKNLEPREKIILLGDFNSYTNNQVNSKEVKYKSKTSTFIENIKNIKGKDSYIECGEDKDYTYCSSGIWCKLDHILISKGLKEFESEFIENINFSKNKQEGFTDHCMLSIIINDF